MLCREKRMKISNITPWPLFQSSDRPTLWLHMDEKIFVCSFKREDTNHNFNIASSEKSTF